MENIVQQFMLLAKKLHRDLTVLLDKQQSQIEAISERDKADDKPKEPEPTAPAQRVRAEIYLPEEEINRYYGDQDKTYKLQRRTFWVGVLTLIAIVGYTAVTYRQWRTMDNTFNEVRKQSAYAKEAANAAHSAADTADATLKSSQQQFRTQQRPFVWLRPQLGLFPNDIAVNQVTLQVLKARNMQFFINVEAYSGGHSPAISMINTAPIVIFDKTNLAIEKLRHYVPEYLSKTGMVLAPDTGFLLPSAKPIPITQELLDDLKSGRKTMFVVARAKYTDMFAPKMIDSYETAFCVSINPEGMPFSNCKDTTNSWIK